MVDIPSYSAFNSSLVQPKIKFTNILPTEMNFGTEEKRKENHDLLLSYLLGRLDSVATVRSGRLRRMARIDREISTWQKLSEEDTQRSNREELTGQPQAIHLNLPLNQMHLDDIVSFYAGIYSPDSGSFVQLPKTDTQAESKALVEKMNSDGVKAKFYKNLVSSLRALNKYNVGGVSVEWCTAGGATQDKDGWNDIGSIDMYNYMYDGSIEDPADIPNKAEWAATICIEDLRALKQMEIDSEMSGIGLLINSEDNPSSTGLQSAKYYKMSPRVAGITSEDAKSGSNKSMDWSAYGASLATDGRVNVTGWEVITMYCWLIPNQFGLSGDKGSDTFQLWKFKILGAMQIVDAKNISGAVTDSNDVPPEQAPYYNQIPHFIGYLVNDDMGEAQRSQSEHIKPFSTYASFLLNSNIDNTRGRIFGGIVYDPTVVDMGTVPRGENTFRIASKIPGRDIRTAIQSFNAEADTSKNMEQLQQLMQLFDRFFPTQAMPSQIAGIDRAVQSQVSAVVQGASRKHHMFTRAMDDDILGPARMMAFTNVVRYQSVDTTGISDASIRLILGSGLQQLNKELVAGQLKELLFTLIQNPQSAGGIDLLGLMNYWSGMLAIPEDLSSFAKQAPAAATTPTPPAPTLDTATPAPPGY